MLVFVSLFIYQQVYAVSKYINEENTCNLKYTDCWKFLQDTQPESDLELANLFHKKEDKFLYPDFNYFHSFQLVPYIQKDGYKSISDGDIVFSVSLYPNMSSLENYKVYNNMTGIGDTRVYTNLSSLGDNVFPNMSSLESSKVFPNMSSLESSKVFPNMSSLESSKVFPNMSSLIK
jgi:hypothetical protein